MTIYFKDGQYYDEQDIQISVEDRGYYFGDGIYEVIKVYNGVLYTAQEHLERLFHSAKSVKLTLPYTLEQFVTIAQQLLERNTIQTGHIYIQVTRGATTRYHQFPPASVTPVVMGYAIQNPRPIDHFEQGVTVKSVEDVRWLRCDIKSLNLLGNVLAKQEAMEVGHADALLVRDGIVTEGSASNMFGIKDGVVYTHPVSNLILNGITRQVVLQLCKQLEVPIREEAFSLDEARQMDEFFLTSTTAEVTPVTKIDETTIGNGQRGPITLKLQQAFEKQIPLTEV